MSGPAGSDSLWIIGPGRAGLALGLMLYRAGDADQLVYTGRRDTPPAHPLFAGDPPAARYGSELVPPEPAPGGVVIAVPDTALAELAASLALLPITEGTPVLHLSGARGRDALAPLEAAGWSTGALHPLAAIAGPVEGAARLQGVWWGVEADGLALLLAGRIVGAASGRILRVAPGAKPLYHAAAVFASNYVVALLGVAERLIERAGADPGAGRAALLALAAGAVANAGDEGIAAALTGPVARGDAATLRLHLASLSEAERALYWPLARATLALAREQGIPDDAALAIERLLEEGEP